jgi:aspartyl-tRNA(Asn)/glutamyl-tRNA(Gln) amidotransferase subunit A
MGEDSGDRSWFDLSPGEQSLELRRCASEAAIIGPRLNATIALSAIGQARTGPLRAMPYVTKDMFDRAERRAEWGGCRSPGTAPEDAEILRRLDAAGGVQVAVVSMTALAYEPSGYNAALGRTRNPWHPDIVTGGSSSGSAAMVAGCAAYLGIGSDTGGSVRIPAACCGIIGLKPGWGELPLAGAMPLAPSLDTIGFFARKASDLAPVWTAVAGAKGDGQSIGSLALLGHAFDASAPVVQHGLSAALKVLAEAGIAHRPVDSAATIAAADEACLTIMQAEAARIHGAPGAPTVQNDAALTRRIEKGWSIPDEALAEALARRPGLRESFLASLQGCDAAILPVMPMQTPLAAEADPTDPAFRPRVLYAMSSLTRFVNVLGLPAIAIPVGFDDRGAPLSVQVVGRPGSELALLGLAATYQQLTTWHERRPAALEDPGASQGAHALSRKSIASAKDMH